MELLRFASRCENSGRMVAFEQLLGHGLSPFVRNAVFISDSEIVRQEEREQEMLFWGIVQKQSANRKPRLGSGTGWLPSLHEIYRWCFETQPLCCLSLKCGRFTSLPRNSSLFFVPRQSNAGTWMQPLQPTSVPGHISAWTCRCSSII